MPRGFKYDRTETEKAHAEGRITEKDSFIGRAPDGSLHELLVREDKRRRHDEVLERSKGFCQGCEMAHYIGPLGEWHHRRGGLSGRCDCIHNAQWVCPAFHRARHVQVMWTHRKGR